MQTPDILIKQALTGFGIVSEDCRLIRHNENITCKVTFGEKAYSLRIHSPVDGFNTSLITGGFGDAECMRNEAELLVYMRNHGFPELQEPVKGADGQYVQTLSDGTPAMLLSWVDGEPIQKSLGAEYAAETAKTAVKIHRAADGFRGLRPSYDETLIDRLADELASASQTGHISDGDAKICIGELREIKATIARLKSKPGGFGIIHADLGFGNLIVTDNGLVPIDFSLSGFGCFAQEAGMIMSNYASDDSLASVLDGFRKSGEDIDENDALLFLSLSVLLFIGAQHGKYHAEEWFIGAMRRWCGTLFTHGR